MTVDLNQLSALVADRLRLVAVDLQPIRVQCAWPVYRATAVGCEPMFVKVTEHPAAERTLTFLQSAGSCPFLPKARIPEALDFNGKAVLCLEWKESTRVNAEDMTEGQLGSLVEGCRQMAMILSRYEGPIMPRAEEDSPDRQYAAIEEYAQRHRLVGRLLRPLLALPAAERTYGDRELAIVHGDLQPRNYGFDGDRFAAVYDTDDLTEGLACELRESGSDVYVGALCPGPVKTNFMVNAGATEGFGIGVEECVAYAMKKMRKGKTLIVPSAKVRFGLFMTRFLPRSLVLKFVGSFQKNKK